LADHQGVKNDSELNKLDFYHVTKGLPPCLAHDLFEGVVRYDLALLIKAMISPLGWFTVNFLNRRIEKFSYSTEERRDKPCRLPPKLEKIPGKVCQVCAFIRLAAHNWR